ncbi:MAG: M48 family metallopeptidase [Chitinophagaceae bacterium]|nr:M48 family metallopeptidase [Chitinophagaceae bacterium]
MKKYLILLFAITMVAVSCHRNAITGRKQLNLIPESEVQSMAFSKYKEFMTANPAISATGSKDAVMVKRVGDRIIESIKQYYTEKGLSKELENFQWEVNLVNNKEPNAWCMPGGKIVVYTGILPYTANEAGLAVVMGHEVAHALARHGNERMSQALVQQLGGMAFSAALASKPAETQNLFMISYGIGSNIGAILPFSRKNELEADRLGLMFSALAGYDPLEAIAFWKRMSAASGGNKPPEFLSTHPADETRIAELQKIMDQTVTQYYRK